MPPIIVVRTQREQDERDSVSGLFFIFIMAAIFLVFIGWGIVRIYQENTIYVWLFAGMLILFLFRKKIFKGNGQAKNMRFKDSIKAFVVYFITYTLGIYLYLNYVALRLNTSSYFLSYLYLGIILMFVGKVGGFITNKKWIFNKQTLVWIPVYMWISYLLITSNLIFTRLPMQSLTFAIILGIGVTLCSRFAWNCIYKRY